MHQKPRTREKDSRENGDRKHHYEKMVTFPHNLLFYISDLDASRSHTWDATPLRMVSADGPDNTEALRSVEIRMKASLSPMNGGLACGSSASTAPDSIGWRG